MKNIKIIIVLLLGLIFGLAVGLNWPTTSAKTHEHKNQQFYTCSMHPSVHHPGPGTCPICGMDLILESNNSGLELRLSDSEIKWSGIQTVTVNFNQNQDYHLMFDGETVSDSSLDFSESIEFDGRIEKMEVSEIGQYIKKGQFIASVYSPELFSDVQAYQRAEGDLKEVLKKRLINFGLSSHAIKANTPVFPIYAKHSGYVSQVNFNSGDSYSARNPLYTVNSQKKLRVYLNAKLEDVKELKLGDKFQVFFMSDDLDYSSGSLVVIEDRIDRKSSYIRLIVEIENSLEGHKPGSIVKAMFHPENSGQGVWIPESSVLWTGKRSVVYLKKENSFQIKNVVLGRLQESKYKVIEGLSEGDEIVLEGAFVLDAESQLRGGASMMNESGDQEILSQVENQELSMYFEVKDLLVLSDLNQLRDFVVKSKLGGKLNTSSLEMARKDFFNWSENLSELLQEKSSIQIIYEQQCPMAFGNKGATWLSLEQEIKNPYFGSEMLNCGINKTKY